MCIARLFKLPTRLSATLLLLLLTALSMPAFAATEAGRVIMASGQTTATAADGETRTLARRSVVYVGDTLHTGTNALLQLRFSDDALMTLRANTELSIIDYQKGGEGQEGSALMELVTGGFRTITGSIGKRADDTYRVDAATASLGIRGTHYDMLQTTDQRLLIGVLEGGIWVKNAHGSLELGRDRQFSYSQVQMDKPPAGLKTAPSELEETLPALEAEDSESEADQGGASDQESTADQESATDQEQETQTTESTSTTLVTETVSTTSFSEMETFDFTATDLRLQEELEGEQKVSEDPRLTGAEYEQLLAANRLGTVVLSGMGEVQLATLTAPDTVTGFDYATFGSASFDLEYSFDKGETLNSVTVMLSSDIADLDSLLATINEDLIAADSPVLARESTLEPGKLEFYVVESHGEMHFSLTNYQTSGGEVTLMDLEKTLGGLHDGSYGYGWTHTPVPMNAIVVYDENGNPSFVVPEQEGMDDDDFVFVDAEQLGPYVIGRLGEAVEGETVIGVGGRENISWGVWNASEENPIYVYEDIDDPDSFDTETQSVYWLSAEAANTADLTGSAIFATTGPFLGSGSDGAVVGVNGSFFVDFESGAITDGSLAVATANDNWNVGFAGHYQNAQALMSVTAGEISGLTQCAACVEGDLSGVFVAPGDAFAGGFNLRKTGSDSVHVEGLMLMEKQ